MRHVIGLALGGMAFLFLPGVDLPAQQPSTTSPQIQPTATVSPEEQKEIRAAIDRWLLLQHQMAGKTRLETLHTLLDEVLKGEQLPAGVKQSFITLFAPSKKALHQFLDDQYTTLQRQLETRGQSRGKLSHLKSPPSERSQTYQVRDQTWQDDRAVQRIAYRGVGTPPRLPSRSLYLMQAAEGSESVSSSGDVGNGMKGNGSLETVSDTANSVAEGSGGQIEITGPSAGATGDLGIGFANRARVNRCPSAAGMVPGKSDSRGGFSAKVVNSSGSSGSGGFEIVDHVIAEGHVGDDAIIKDVRLEFDWTYTKKQILMCTSSGWQAQPHGTLTVLSVLLFK